MHATAFQGRRALVTGGARRLGRAVAEALAAAGADVAIHCNTSVAEAEDLARRMEQGGVRAAVIRADLDVPAEAEALVGEAEACLGPLDFIVNNASVFPRGTWQSMTPASLLRAVQINAFAPLQIVRAWAGRGRRGAVVNLLDSRIAGCDRAHAEYHLSKRMLFDITRLLAMELAPGVRVNAVAPGLILPPEGETESYLRRRSTENPLRSWGSPDEVAAAVLLLLGSAFVTGEVLFVDGGAHLRGGCGGGAMIRA